MMGSYDLLGEVAALLMLFTVAEWVVHRRVDEVGGAHVVPQVLLGRVDTAVGL